MCGLSRHPRGGLPPHGHRRLSPSPHHVDMTVDAAMCAVGPLTPHGTPWDPSLRRPCVSGALGSLASSLACPPPLSLHLFLPSPHSSHPFPSRRRPPPVDGLSCVPSRARALSCLVPPLPRDPSPSPALTRHGCALSTSSRGACFASAAGCWGLIHAVLVTICSHILYSVHIGLTHIAYSEQVKLQTYSEHVFI